MKTGENVRPAYSPMFKNSSQVAREGEEKTKQIDKNTKKY